jgi:hypothetical protein
MASNYRRKAQDLARRLGAVLHTGDDEVNCEAPTGFVWSEDRLHEMINSPWDAERQSDMWKVAYERMLPGLEPCGDPDCEWCHPEPVDTERASR